MIDLTDLKDQTIIGGYRRVTSDKAVIVTSLDKAKSKSMVGAYCAYRCRGKYAQMTGFLLGLFRERFDATVPGEEFRWRNTRFIRMTTEEYWKIILDGPYKMAFFRD